MLFMPTKNLDEVKGILEIELDDDLDRKKASVKNWLKILGTNKKF